MISEIKCANEWLHDGYQRVKTKTLTFIAASLATLTFLYADGEIFVPAQTYGKIFYFAGLGLMIGAMIMLFASLLPRHWEFSLESKDLKQFEDSTKIKYLEHVKERYLTAYKMNFNTYEENHKTLNRAFFPLIIGAILLVVLKIFGAEGIEELCQKMMERQ